MSWLQTHWPHSRVPKKQSTWSLTQCGDSEVLSGVIEAPVATELGQSIMRDMFELNHWCSLQNALWDFSYILITPFCWMMNVTLFLAWTTWVSKCVGKIIIIIARAVDKFHFPAQDAQGQTYSMMSWIPQDQVTVTLSSAGWDGVANDRAWLGRISRLHLHPAPFTVLANSQGDV